MHNQNNEPYENQDKEISDKDSEIWDEYLNKQLQHLVLEYNFDFQKISEILNGVEHKGEKLQITKRMCEIHWYHLYQSRRRKKQMTDMEIKAQKFNQLQQKLNRNQMSQNLQELIESLPHTRQNQDFLEIQENQMKDIKNQGNQTMPSGFNILKDKIRNKDKLESKQKELDFLRSLDQLTLDDSEKSANKPLLFKGELNQDKEIHITKEILTDSMSNDIMSRKIDLNQINKELQWDNTQNLMNKDIEKKHIIMEDEQENLLNDQQKQQKQDMSNYRQASGDQEMKEENFEHDFEMEYHVQNKFHEFENDQVPLDQALQDFQDLNNILNEDSKDLQTNLNSNIENNNNSEKQQSKKNSMENSLLRQYIEDIKQKQVLKAPLHQESEIFEQLEQQINQEKQQIEMDREAIQEKEEQIEKISMESSDYEEDFIDYQRDMIKKNKENIKNFEEFKEERRNQRQSKDILLKCSRKKQLQKIVKDEMENVERSRFDDYKFELKEGKEFQRKVLEQEELRKQREQRQRDLKQIEELQKKFKEDIQINKLKKKQQKQQELEEQTQRVALLMKQEEIEQKEKQEEREKLRRIEEEQRKEEELFKVIEQQRSAIENSIRNYNGNIGNNLHIFDEKISYLSSVSCLP